MFRKETYTRVLLILITIAGTNVSFCQELVFEKEMKLKIGLKDKREVLPVVKEDKMMVIFFLDNFEITALGLNQDLQETDEYKIPRKQVVYNTLLGHNIYKNEYHLFFSNKNKNEFFIQTVDISKKQSSTKTLEIKLKKEKFLEAISYMDKFYILTVKRPTSILKLYEFEGSNLKLEKEFDFSKHKFSHGNYPSLYHALSKKGVPYRPNLSVAKIDAESPVPLEIAAYSSKLYVLNNKIFITIDNSLGNTKIIQLDLRTYEHSFESILHEYLECGETWKVGSNSFLTNDALFQVKSCKSGLSLRTKDFKTKKLMSEYSITKDDEILFKNGPIKQEGGIIAYTQGKDKELEKTKRVLRRISDGKIGISAHQTGKEITLTIGGYTEVQQVSIAGTDFDSQTNISAPDGNIFIPEMYLHNSTMYSYFIYKNTRAVYFKSILDDTSYKHVEGEVIITAYDKIKEFEESIPANVSNETLFRLDDCYLFGYYDKLKKTYSLFKFFDN